MAFSLQQKFSAALGAAALMTASGHAQENSINQDIAPNNNVVASGLVLNGYTLQSNALPHLQGGQTVYTYQRNTDTGKRQGLHLPETINLGGGVRLSTDGSDGLYRDLSESWRLSLDYSRNNLLQNTAMSRGDIPKKSRTEITLHARYRF